MNFPKPKTGSKHRQLIKKDTSFIHFINNMKHHICTVRFNDETWNENVEFRKNNPNISCIYSVDSLISSSIELDSILFVLEMNNDMNKIIGIGMVRNKPFFKKHNVYKNEKYNEFSYTGKHRIDRKDMNEEEETILKVFDMWCFTGKDHLKRLKGIKLFPLHKLFECLNVEDFSSFISTMFKKRILLSNHAHHTHQG